MTQAKYDDLFRIVACEETSYGVVYHLQVDGKSIPSSREGQILPYAVAIKSTNEASLSFAYSRMAQLVAAVGVDCINDTDDIIGEYVVGWHDGTAIARLEPALIKRAKPAKPRKWWHWLICWRQ